MPQAELNYTANIHLNAEEVLVEIERVISNFDPNAGACKGRAFKVSEYNHSHILLNLAVMPRPHRNSEWIDRLGNLLEQTLYEHIQEPCHLAIEIRFLSENYRSYPPKSGI